MVRPLAPALLALLLLGSTIAHAREVWRSANAHLSLEGSLRELVTLGSGTDRHAFENALLADPGHCLAAATLADCAAFDEIGRKRTLVSLSRLRLRADASWGSRLSALAILDNEARFGHLGTLESSLAEDLASPSFIDLTGERGGATASWRATLYRGYLLFETSRSLLTLGRQRIAWGVGRLWNPIDRFNAIPPLALEADQSPGVDAVDARWLWDDLHSVELVFAPGRHSEDHAYAARLHGTAHDVDYSLMAGVFDEAPSAGLDLAGNLGGAAARLEAVYAYPRRTVSPLEAPGPRRLGDFFQIVVSLDYSFDVGNGVYGLLEHLYNGNALGFGHGRAGSWLPFFEGAAGVPSWKPVSRDRFGGSRVITRSAQLTGAELGYDITPELRADLLVIFDWQGVSSAFFPSLRYSPLDWLELTLGLQSGTGPHRSEFGAASTLGYLMADLYF